MTAATAPAAVPLQEAPRRSVQFVPPKDERGVGVILIDRPDDAVNAIDARMLEDLDGAVRVARESAIRGLVVASAKEGQFVAGADLTLIANATREDAAYASRELQRILGAIESLPFTTVAAIGGPALGGGLELALACDRRIAADAPSVRLGLTELRFGLIPAAGGTQRLPRLVGLPRALDMILTSRMLSARRAHRAGLVDEVVHPAVLMTAAMDHAARDAKRKPEGGKTPQERAATWLAPARAYAFSQARSRVTGETRGHYPAPLRALDAMATGLAKGIPAGLEAEARAFGELASGETARCLTRIALLTLRQRRAALDGLADPREVKNVGVVGLGFMGSGIAQAASSAGMTVRARDRDAAAVAKGLENIRRLTTDAAKKGVFERREAARIIGRVSGGPDLSGFSRADLVIEAVFEDIATKRKVVADLEAVVRDDCVIASNTSALPIGEIAREAKRPERIVGMHFFSPVHKMPLVEVIRPAGADEASVATAVATAIAMGKTPIVVGDSPGFYTTRVLSTMIADAFALLAEGVAIDEIDRAMTAFGWPVGPLQLVDEVGLEVAGHAGETVARARGIEPPAIVSALVAEGKKGKGRGGGFYRYDGKKRTPDPRVYEILRVAPVPAHEDVAERLTRTFVRDALRCLDEGVLRSADEGDIGAVLGLGFPPFLGGPFQHARAKGIRA